MVRTGLHNLLLACASLLFMLSPAQSSAASSIDISTADFAISEQNLQITRDLIHSSQEQTLPSASASAWLDLRHNSIRLSPIMGFAGKQIAPARRVRILTDTIAALTGLPIVPAVQQAALATAGESIPDPAPLGFLGLGLIALALARRRRRINQVAPPREEALEPEPLALAA